MVLGSLRARNIVVAEHRTHVGGSVSRVTVDFGGFRVDTPGFVPTISHDRATRCAKEVFVPEVLDAQGHVSGLAMMKRLRAGLAFLAEE